MRVCISLLLAASLFCLNAAPSVAQTFSPPPLLFTGMDGILISDGGMEIPIWGYGLTANGYITVPGPLLEYETGDDVNLSFVNNSPESHTIHLHGLDVDQANDGVPTTSFIVIQDDVGSYEFTASEPGTFFYHCHVTTTLHLTMGMYGMILVRHPGGVLFEGGPAYYSDAPLLFSDLEIATNLDPVQSFPFHDIRPDYFMVNGRSGSQLETGSSGTPGEPGTILSCPNGESLALRLGSMAYTLTKLIIPAELGAMCYMSDGRPVPTPFGVEELNIYPGERFTVLISPDAEYDGTIEVQSWDMVNREYVHSNFVRIRDAALNVGDTQIQNPLTLSISPNPSRDFISVNSSDGRELADWTIYNTSGKIIAKGYSSEPSMRIDISLFASGSYILESINGDLKCRAQFVR
ncbi:MAG: multicopper oxidase family protein [Flavobacteriales bacterium]|nr:multicopper oxidase family protein [Flavobacteriales bacterium]